MEKLDLIISGLREKVSSYFDKDSTGHNIDHLKRTLNYAKYLQAKEGGDLLVVGIAAFIHDIHRILSAQEKRYVSPKESLPVVEEFIKDLDITDKQKEHILHAIEHHEEYAFGGGVTVTDIESKILQDADNLDAVGAIGIVRTFKYGISHGLKDYDETIPLYQNKFTEEKNDESTIHHIHNKLLRLGDYMNTKAAKSLAQKKTDLMKQFMDMFIGEWTGKFD